MCITIIKSTQNEDTLYSRNNSDQFIRVISNEYHLEFEYKTHEDILEDLIVWEE